MNRGARETRWSAGEGCAGAGAAWQRASPVAAGARNPVPREPSSRIGNDLRTRVTLGVARLGTTVRVTTPEHSERMRSGSAASWTRRADSVEGDGDAAGAVLPAFPDDALRRVFEHDAFRVELLADLVGAAEVLRLARGLSLLDQRVDSRVE